MYIKSRLKASSLLILVVLFLMSLSWMAFIRAPQDQKTPILVAIKDGYSVKQISHILEDKNVIRSSSFFVSISLFPKSSHNLLSGIYLFEGGESVFKVLNRLKGGDFNVDALTITFPEGATALQIASIAENKLPYFNREDFIQLAIQHEGYLFPDTYQFFETATALDVFKTLTATFENRLKELDFSSEEISIDDVVTMASIVEKEATKEARQEVANILWKRINDGMPLQVDAAFVYERGKGTFDLTRADLLRDTSYNTYTRKGLPPTPIGNPGFDSLKAAAFPQETENVFFLTGHDGNMYYAETHDGHLKNRREFLD